MDSSINPGTDRQTRSATRASAGGGWTSQSAEQVKPKRAAKAEITATLETLPRSDSVDLSSLSSPPTSLQSPDSSFSLPTSISLSRSSIPHDDQSKITDAKSSSEEDRGRARTSYIVTSSATQWTTSASNSKRLVVSLVLPCRNIGTDDSKKNEILTSSSGISTTQLPKTTRPRRVKRKSDDEDFVAGPNGGMNISVGNGHDDSLSDSPPPLKRSRKPNGRAQKVTDESFTEPQESKQTKAKRGKAPVEKYDGGNVTTQYPEPYGQPSVWAIKRQALCETLDYYRAYQSAAYSHDKIVKGFLIDKEVRPTDRFTEEVLISGVGGGQDVDATGKRTQTKDQTVSKIAQYFQRTTQQGLPVAIIAGHGNKISPCALPYRYNVLDWFHVTDVWCEKAPLQRWMVRFEKINLHERSWWSPKESAISSVTSVGLPGSMIDHSGAISQTCINCGSASKTTYVQGWVCLNNNCTSYFNFAEEVDLTTLDYCHSFLNERTKYEGPSLEPLSPPLLTAVDQQRMNAFGVERAFKRGIVCPKCKCCIRRTEWRQWTCENPDCDLVYRLNQKPMPISYVLDNSMSSDEATSLIRGGIRAAQKPLGLYDVYEFILTGQSGDDIGFVRLFKSCDIINQQKDGPNDMFQQMQDGEFGLRKYPARNKGSAIEVSTAHWTSNFGAPYKFAVAQATRAFEDAPDVIIKALKRMTWAGEQAVTAKFETFHAFNELLALGYFEDANIGYHDDGEDTLGPTVATLSLGCPAYMSFRPKTGSNIGGPPRTRGTGRSKVNPKQEILKILLEHGDIVVMHGRDIHRFYEHAVEPKGKLRFALTSRYIRPETLSNAAEREDARLKSIIPAHLADYVYDGDMDAKPIGEVSDPVEEARKALSRVLAQVRGGELSSEMGKTLMDEFKAQL